MSDRSQLENILSTAGLPATGVQQCLDIFEREMITPTVLPQLSVEDFRDMGVLTGHRRLLFNYLHGVTQTQAGASAPPPEAIPLCEKHDQPISGMCTEPGCQCLVCNDCASVGNHRSHKVVDSPTGVDILRSQLKSYKPSDTLAERIQTQRNRVTTLRSQLAKEEQELKKMEEEEQEQAAAHTRITQSLSQTENLSVGADTLNALKQLHQLVTSLGETFSFDHKIRFTEIIGPEHIQVTESGRKLHFIGQTTSWQVGVIDPTPITSGNGVVEWAVLPNCNRVDKSWVGCGVIPVCDVSKLKLRTTNTFRSLHGWSANSYQWQGVAGRNDQPAAKDNQVMRLRLDCEKATLTLNGGAAVIRDIPFPVHCFAILHQPNNELSVVECQ